MAEDIKVERVLPAEPPISVVVVAQCGQAIGLYATMADGRLLAFDMSSGIPWGQQTAWIGKSTGRVITVESKCVVMEGDLTPT
jgi:hypothetical protein